VKCREERGILRERENNCYEEIKVIAPIDMIVARIED
jgi:hypothetical protein